MERLGKYFTAETISRNKRGAVFFVRPAPRGYKKNKEYNLSQPSSGLGSCSRDLRESSEFADYLRRNDKKGIRMLKEHLIVLQ
jgi:hypothetical protein